MLNKISTIYSKQAVCLSKVLVSLSAGLLSSVLLVSTTIALANSEPKPEPFIQDTNAVLPVTDVMPTEEEIQEREQEAQRIEAERVAAEQAEQARIAQEVKNSQLEQARNLDGNNQKVPQEVFVEVWAPRIDRYLSGSRLAGHGVTFASAAWVYNVDPRWSPAISCIESSKGAYCFRTYNAWGWGGMNFSSWGSAIDTHVSGLRNGYGYTVSQGAANKYCPPNATSWYYDVKSEMGRI